MHFHHIPTGDHVAGAEVFEEDAAAHANFFGIDLHQIAGMLEGPVFRLANGPRTLAQFAVLSEQDRGFRRFVQRTATLKSGQNAADHGNGDVEFFASEQHHQLVLAPARILLAQRQDTLGQCGCPGGLTYVARPMRALLQGSEIVPVKAAQPAIKSLPADAEVPTGACSVPSIEEIEKHPLKSRSCRAAQTLSEARQLARLGKLIPSDLAHPDTLPSVTNHSERAQFAATMTLNRRLDIPSLAAPHFPLSLIG